MKRVKSIIKMGIVIVFFASAGVIPSTRLLAQDGGGVLESIEVFNDDTTTSEDQIFNEDKIFDEEIFKETIEESKAQEKVSRLETLIGSDFIFSASYTQPVDLETYSMSSLFYGKVFSKATYPDIVSLFVSYNFSIPIFYYTGNIEPYTGYPSSSVYAELSELFMSFDVYKKVFFRIGYQLVAWGPSTFWTPVDFINRDRVDPLAELDLRTGKPGAKIHIPFERSNLFLFFDFSQSIGENTTTSSIADRTRIGARFDTVLLGYEIGLNTYIGKDMAALWGLDWSGVLFRTDFYGEIAVSPSSNTPKARLIASPNTYELYYPQEFIVATSVGLSKTFGELKLWTVRTELFFNSNGYESDAPYSYLLSQNLFSPLYMGKLYGYLSITKDDLFTQDIKGTLALLMNVLDPSFDLSTTLGFDFPNLIPFNVKLSFAGGEDGKEFTFFGGQALILTVYTKVSI